MELSKRLGQRSGVVVSTQILSGLGDRGDPFELEDSDDESGDDSQRSSPVVGVTGRLLESGLGEIVLDSEDDIKEEEVEGEEDDPSGRIREWNRGML